METVYWIHEPHHTDPYTQGYIGVTSCLKKRLPIHRRSNPHFFTPNTIIDTLHSYDNMLECNQKEREYRPTINIGYNKAAGGSRSDMPRDTRVSVESSGSAFRWYGNKLITVELYNRINGIYSG